MATRFMVGIPNTDVNDTIVDLSSLQSSMELIASDGITHSFGQDTRFAGGSFIEQFNTLYWDIADGSLSTAESNLATFASGFTFRNPPDQHAWSLSL